MLAIFLKTVPFFLLIGLGYLAGRWRWMSADAVVALTRFVFYFALSAMLFQFASSIPLTEIFEPGFVAAYVLGTGAVYVLVTAVALMRGTGRAQAAIEAQCGVVGNVGFLGLPMLVILLGPQAAGPMLMVLSVDLLLFGSLVVIAISMARGGDGSALAVVGRGLVRNPMVMSMAAGLTWGAVGVELPVPAGEFLTLLGAAATPCALFTIGASLAEKSAERVSVALWLSFAKLVLHPLAVAVLALGVFGVAAFPAGVMVAAAAMPVAGNVYIIAQHYGVAPARASSAILVSTVLAVASLSAVIALVAGPGWPPMGSGGGM
ncbi:AEC family transporter [Algicella marina]|uniref:AEC family transporter n=1 Tax=Algicella marina TaxID=2683284 RepID=A0A6P1T3T8_9RHOB|nr:AEC family transporter [Algicella marina]QHQ36353.1 AEC family transporter [Algicella marina]